MYSSVLQVGSSRGSRAEQGRKSRTREIREQERCCEAMRRASRRAAQLKRKKAQKGEAEVSRAEAGRCRVRVVLASSRNRREWAHHDISPAAGTSPGHALPPCPVLSQPCCRRPVAA